MTDDFAVTDTVTFESHTTLDGRIPNFIIIGVVDRGIETFLATHIGSMEQILEHYGVVFQANEGLFKRHAPVLVETAYLLVTILNSVGDNHLVIGLDLVSEEKTICCFEVILDCLDIKGNPVQLPQEIRHLLTQ